MARCERHDCAQLTAALLRFCAPHPLLRANRKTAARRSARKVGGQTRLLLQQERSDQVVRLGRVHVAAVDRQPVITTDELVVDNLPRAVGVLHEGRRIAVCAVPRNARGIGQLRASFTHRLRKAVDALLAVHESGTDAESSGRGGT